jgi:hypothetical protein
MVALSTSVVSGGNTRSPLMAKLMVFKAFNYYVITI